jgi:hypothetical protein
VRISYFALSSEVSLDQADHVSSEEPIYNTRAGSATPAPLLTKLIFLVVTPSANSLYLLLLVFPVRRVVCLCSKLNRVFDAPTKGAYAQSLIRSSWFSCRTRRGAYTRSLTRSSRDIIKWCLYSKLNKVSKCLSL